jgi:hypothetical protein
VASEPCPACGAPLDYVELHLTDTKTSFPLLGRELLADSPTRTCLQVFTCLEDGLKWARWHDHQSDQLRQIKMTPETIAWVE